MLPWKNSWFQIAFFAWLVSGALLVVDYAPKIPFTSEWMTAFHRAPKQPSEAPAKPSPPNEQQSPVEHPTPAQQPHMPAREEPTTKVPSAPSGKDEATANVTMALKALRASDGKSALSLSTQACIAGNLHGCDIEADLYANQYAESKALGVAQDETKAFPLYRKACDGGYEDACLGVAGHYAVGGDMKTFFSLLNKFCDEGKLSACDLLFAHYAGAVTKPIIPKDPARALEVEEKMCTFNRADACDVLGDLYRNNSGFLNSYGITVSPDPTQAIAFYRKACAGTLADGGENDAIACLGLKQLNATDKGIAHDYAQSLAINRKHCSAKDVTGCGDLGIMYENGLGVPTDLNEAIALYTKGCDPKHDQRGCVALKRLGK